MDLARAQFLSLITKGITRALGIVQTFLVITLLGAAEFGLAGLVLSIGGVIGVSQHLGIQDGAIREIAVLNKPREIGKVFWVSHIVRQVVTIPLSLLLLVGAEFIATRLYGKPEIIPYIQLFAAVLVLQGIQDVLGASLTGLKRFGALYVIQIVTAVINVGVFWYLVWAYGVTGFFWAIIATTLIMVVLLGAATLRALPGSLSLPSLSDIALYGRRVLRIGVFMYVARIFFVAWQRLPLLLLGGVLAAEELGYLNLSLTFGSQFVILAMALSEVNLSWMSSLYVNQREEFVRIVTRNMHRLLVVLMGMALVLMFFAPEILLLFADEFTAAHPLVLIMTVAFFLYSLVDIGTSSVFVPADQPKLRAIVYGVITAVSAGLVAFLLVAQPDALLAAWSVLAGAALGYALTVLLSARRFSVPLLTGQLGLFLLALGLSLFWLLQQPSLPWRVGVFVLLGGYVTYEAWRHNLLPSWKRLLQTDRAEEPSQQDAVICFAGAAYGAKTWTNRQHVMSRVAATRSVLYVEPRVWIVRYVLRHWRRPMTVFRYVRRLFTIEQQPGWKQGSSLHVISQWNLIPYSREVAWIARFNHALNRRRVLRVARRLGMLTRGASTVVWLYDTEAAEYLDAFFDQVVVYDCVDDHAAQAGVDRNPARVRDEEQRILQRADLVTVTSRKLLTLKQQKNANTHLVLNAADVETFATPEEPPVELLSLPRPLIGTVGALDSYKVNFDVLLETAMAHPEWSFVFVGEPLVEQRSHALQKLRSLPNTYFPGAVGRADVPGYVQAFDVCLIPYRDNQYNAASFPLKFWEFMAAGKPIVVTGAPELRAYAEHILYSDDPHTIGNSIAQALAAPGSAPARVALARDHSWEKRVEKLLALVAEVGAKRSS